MTKKQSNDYRMFVNTQQYMDLHTFVWNVIAKIVLYKIDLDELISRISAKSEDADGLESVTERKDTLKGMVEIKISGLSGMLQSYAYDVGKVDFAKTIKATKSDLGDMKEGDLLIFSKMVLKKATKKVGELADFGIGSEMLTEMQTTVDEFGALVGQPRTILNTKFIALETIEELFAECRILLNKKMDNNMLMFRESNPEYHSGYVRARTIVDR